MNTTSCAIFEPFILEGQLCYSLDIANSALKSTKAGQSNGLFLIVDPYPYRLNTSNEMKIAGQTLKPEEGHFKVYVHTLAQYTGYGSGTYAMSSLKKMKGTTSFKKLPESQKRCQVHNRENCQTNNFLGQVLTQCECVPWDLMDGTTLEKVNLSFNDFTLSPQVNTFCTPGKETCVANRTLKDKSCSLHWALR